MSGYQADNRGDVDGFGGVDLEERPSAGHRLRDLGFPQLLRGADRVELARVAGYRSGLVAHARGVAVNAAESLHRLPEQSAELAARREP
jgi:hypothetical protein